MNSIFEITTTSSLDVTNFLICIGVSLAIGAFLAYIFTIKNSYTESFVVTLALLPAVVCVVIMMVNGNIGAGIAVTGAFSLVRFRSAQGSAKEIVAIFLAMGAGMVAGMGYLVYAILFTLILGGAMVLYNFIGIGDASVNPKNKTMRITIPEDLDYTTVFDDIFEKYTSKYQMVQVKTTNMGSMFKLTYQITLKDPAEEKELIDSIRVRNGNLEIVVTRQEGNHEGL